MPTKKKKLQPRAFWDPNYQELLARDNLSTGFLLRKLILREAHVLEDLAPTFMLICTALLGLFFAVFLPFADTANKVIWLALSMELALFPLFEMCAMRSIQWRAASASAGFVKRMQMLGGYFVSAIIWFPASSHVSNQGEPLDPDAGGKAGGVWASLLYAYLGAKVGYVLGIFIVSKLLYCSLDLDYWFPRSPELRGFLAQHRAVGFRLGKFIAVFSSVVFTVMALMVMWCFGTYQYLEISEPLVQYGVIVAVALADVCTRVWLTALLTKGLVAVVPDADEIQAYVFGLRIVRLGFALVQGFAIGTITGTFPFLLACASNSAFEIGLVCVSALRRHHPRAPHLRERIANALGLPGSRMFAHKTRLETALLILTQEVAELSITPFVVLFGQLPLYFDGMREDFTTARLPWYAVVVRTVVLVFVFEAPTDCFKNYLAVRVFGLDTFHARPRELDLWSGLYMSILALMGFLAILGGHGLFILWEVNGDEDDHDG